MRLRPLKLPCRLARSLATQNHTAHNQSYKNHRNGIKKERVGFSVKGSKPSLKGVSGARDCTYLFCLLAHHHACASAPQH